MTDNAAIVFHGFLNLSTLEKKSLVDAMNEFFDEIPERERIRAENARSISTLFTSDADLICGCCGRPLTAR